MRIKEIIIIKILNNNGSGEPFGSGAFCGSF